MITSEPTENIAKTLIFFCQVRFKLKRIGIGITRIIISWRMLIPAATYATANLSKHFMGGTLYIQFVQLAWNGT